MWPVGQVERYQKKEGKAQPSPPWAVPGTLQTIPSATQPNEAGAYYKPDTCYVTFISLRNILDRHCVLRKFTAGVGVGKTHLKKQMCYGVCHEGNKQGPGQKAGGPLC